MCSEPLDIGLSAMLSVVAFIVEDMSFPTADMTDTLNDYLDTSRIADAIRDQRPHLADALLVEEGRPMLRLTLTDGTAVVGAKIQHNHRIAWTVATPDKPLDPNFGTGTYPGGSIAAWMIDEYDRLAAVTAR